MDEQKHSLRGEGRFITRVVCDSMTTLWRTNLHVSRVQVGCYVYRHRYPFGGERWVFHPKFIYDRAEKDRSAQETS